MTTQLSMGLFFFVIMALLVVTSSPSAGHQSTGFGQLPASEKQNTRPANKQSGGTKSGKAPDAQDVTKRDKDEAVRISVTLVQVDAVVTDGKGRYITAQAMSLLCEDETTVTI